MILTNVAVFVPIFVIIMVGVAFGVLMLMDRRNRKSSIKISESIDSEPPFANSTAQKRARHEAILKAQPKETEIVVDTGTLYGQNDVARAYGEYNLLDLSKVQPQQATDPEHINTKEVELN